ncbi:hypothetical protein C7999DRAFT_13091 [Corynascus novoguineensis]|uniref:Uncharacterized protein n=1 Tax=Corynascus novoguineensis TaxID=1126955 RepID=A0AAN7HRG2_9PEZI|nr:hypothetical protein C7999DRAFT_13091 [Corynascus novoguineensis]
MSVLTGQAPINLGPLTTTFTPPAACTVAVGERRNGLADFFGIGGDYDIAWLGQACDGNKPFDDTSCWPETSKGAEEKEAPLSGWGFYSPGLHCPVGYATACSATGGKGGKSDWPVQFELKNGETAVGCCPRGYGCANINGQTCIMMAESTTVPTVTCKDGTTGDVAFQTVPDEEASITAFSLLAPMIQINWQSSDLPTSTTTSSRRTATKTSTSSRSTTDSTETTRTGTSSSSETSDLGDGSQTTGGETSTDAPTNTPTLQDSDNSSDSSSLSSGVKVAIGVAGSVAVLLMLVCTLFYCWRRRKNDREEQELDRLYGLKNTMNDGGDFTNTTDIPGWYRGQRLATPAHDPFGGYNGNPGFGSEMERPAVPYYRPYRPS